MLFIEDADLFPRSKKFPPARDALRARINGIQIAAMERYEGGMPAYDGWDEFDAVRVRRLQAAHELEGEGL